MVTQAQFRKWALAGEVQEHPHFDKTSFRIKKKIFATLDEKANRACLKLTEIDQQVFSRGSKGAIYAVPNKWGRQGWTFVDLNLVNRNLCRDAVQTACETVRLPKANT